MLHHVLLDWYCVVCGDFKLKLQFETKFFLIRANQTQRKRLINMRTMTQVPCLYYQKSLLDLVYWGKESCLGYSNRVTMISTEFSCACADLSWTSFSGLIDLLPFSTVKTYLQVFLKLLSDSFILKFHDSDNALAKLTEIWLQYVDYVYFGVVSKPRKY